MDNKEKESFEEKMKSMEDILKGFGLSEDMIEDPEKIKKAMSDFGKAWSAKEKLENEGKSLKYSIRARINGVNSIFRKKLKN